MTFVFFLVKWNIQKFKFVFIKYLDSGPVIKQKLDPGRRLRLDPRLSVREVCFQTWWSSRKSAEPAKAAGGGSGCAYFSGCQLDVVVVYHVTIVAIGHGMLKKFWAFLVIGCILRTAGCSFIRNYADPLTLLELLNFYLTQAMRSDAFILYNRMHNRNQEK